jgi:uncharacterized protein
MSFNSSGSSGTNPEPQASGIAMTGNDIASSRIFSLDVLRGIALLGILVVSIWEFGGFTPNKQTFFRTGMHGGNYNLLSFVTIVFEGKMRALFSIVFGAGIILFLSKKESSSKYSVTDLYVRRMLWLMLFGIFNAVVLLWPGDILFQYSVLGILLFPFWRMSRKGLLAAALITTLIYCGKNYWNYTEDQKAYNKFTAVAAVEKKFVAADTVVKKKIDSLLKVQSTDPLSGKLADDPLLLKNKNDTLTKEQAKDKQAWEGLVKGMKYDSTADKKENKEMHSTSYTKTWDHLLGRSQFKESYWLYRTGIWDIGSMVLLGMALLGFGFFGNSYSVKKYLLIALPCIIAGLLLAWFRNHCQDLKLADYAKYMDKNGIPANQFFPVERFLLAIGYAGFIMVLIRIKILNWLWRTLATTGRMAFTNYFLQTIICTIFFYGYGMGYYGTFSQAKLYFMVAEVSLIQIVFSVIWLRHFTMGPVEWLWRYLIYLEKLPFKKKQKETTIPAPVPAAS